MLVNHIIRVRKNSFSFFIYYLLKVILHPGEISLALSFSLVFFFHRPSERSSFVPRSLRYELLVSPLSLSPIAYRPLPRTFSFPLSYELPLSPFPLVSLQSPLFPPCKCAPCLIYFFHADVFSLVRQARI